MILNNEKKAESAKQQSIPPQEKAWHPPKLEILEVRGTAYGTTGTRSDGTTTSMATRS